VDGAQFDSGLKSQHLSTDKDKLTSTLENPYVLIIGSKIPNVRKIQSVLEFVIKENRANATVSTILESSQKLNRTSLRKQKYNLIAEIKEKYNIDNFFGAKIRNYKELAALYTLIEGYNSKEATNTNQLVDNKVTILEYLTKQLIPNEEVKEDVLKEFQTYDKDLRILTYQVLLEKFNSKYQDLSNSQKQVLKEFINAIDSTPSLREFYNTKINELKLSLNTEAKDITDKATQVKVQEITKTIIKNIDLI
jgi:chaperonin GroEL (HSP60 family)